MQNINLPPVINDGKFDREKTAEMLWKYEYGEPLPMPEKTEFEQIDRVDRFCAGKAEYTTVKATVTVNGRQASFPLRVCRPSAPGKYPTAAEHLYEMLGVAPGECAMYDDLCYALRGAKQAGLFTIGVYDAYSDPAVDELRRCCDRFIYHFTDEKKYWG